MTNPVPTRDQLSEALVTGHLWRFSHASGDLAAPALRLLPDGTIANYDHPNERRWRLRDGMLELIAEDGRVSVRFNEISLANGRIHLRGPHLLGTPVLLRLDQRRWGEDETPFVAQTRLRLQYEVDHRGWTIGDHTFGKPLVYSSGPERLHIGRYCSIGDDVTIVLANHRPELLTTYPFALYRNHWPGAPAGLVDHAGKGDVVIGSDVWIGHGAMIMPGVRIGDGAVIGGQAVVTRSVKPYAVVGGNPARLIRFRFDAETVRQLLQLRWWDWPDERVEHCIPQLLSDGIEGLLAAARRHAEPDDA